MTKKQVTRRRSPAAEASARPAWGAPFKLGATAVRGATEDAAARLAPDSYNPRTRTVVAVLSVGARVPRYGAFEELAISPAAIDLRRVALGQVRLLDSHNQSSVGGILGVVTETWIDGGKLFGRFQFSETEAGRSAEGMVVRGEVSAISVGYRVSAWTLAGTENNVEIWRADKWELLEASLVSVPADPEALIRSAQTTHNTHLKGNRMEPEVIDDSNNGDSPERSLPTNDGSRAVMSDRQAREAYDMTARSHLPAEFAQRHIEAGRTVSEFRVALLDRLAADADRTRTDNTRPHNSTSLDNPEFLSRSIEEALYFKMTGKAPTGPAIELAGRSMLEMGAMILQSRGERVSWARRTELAGRIMERSGGHTTSDFPLLLTGAGQRVMQDAYKVAETPLKALARRKTVNDFRPVSAVRLSEAPRLLKVGESGEIKHGSRGEAKESFRVETYARIFSITRNALVNDDLGAFADTSADFGRASAETEADLMAGLLLANAGDGDKLDDGNPVYGTARGNKAAAGTVINVASLGAGRQALREMKGLDLKTPISVTPKHLVVGAAKETEAEQVLAAIAAAQVGDANPFSGKLALHVEPRLTGNAWRLFADPSEIATMVIAYLAGIGGPQIEIRDGWNILGAEFRAVLDFGCAMQDWRGTYLNSGA